MEENKLFETGPFVCSREVSNQLIEDDKFYEFVLLSLEGKYLHGNWGDTCEEDAKMNDEAVKSNEDRIFAVYKMPDTDTTIWIITEWDHSVTTILFPSEY